MPPRTLTLTATMLLTSTIGMSPAPLPRPAMHAVSQRFLAARNLWARQQCVQVVLDMDRFADVLSADLPGFGAALLATFPSMGHFAGPLQRGCFIAEVVGQLAMELQRLAGAAPAAGTVATVRGRANLVTISVPYLQQDVALRACAMALSAVDALVAQSGLAKTPRAAPAHILRRQRDDRGASAPVHPCRRIGVPGHYGLNSSV